ncbi:glycosyl hydrolase [Lysobacter korlensis]|uniref:Glycosyl hydrolase n=1 Tax=Lysobacter korlensis TaxID=553636 RepID=A0ABV6RX55_9GAMM
MELTAMTDPVVAGFSSPPDEARPRVWWHWMNGNIDEPGIRLDLEWMQRVGIRGAQVFEGGMNAPQLVSDRLVFLSEPWRRAMRTAAATAEELGLELTIATSPGWSAAGGPWVEPSDAMKKVVWSETIVAGGGPLCCVLPALPAVSGRYQDVPRWGSPNDPEFARDTRVLAVPALADHDPLIPASAEVDGMPTDARTLWDGLFADGLVLRRDLDGGTSTVTYRYDEPVSIGAVTVGLPGARGFGSAPPAVATLEVSDDGIRFRTVTTLPPSQSPVRSRSFAPVRGRWLRLVLDFAPAGSTVPPMAPGVLPLPFPPPRPELSVTQFLLFGGGRVSAVEEKAGFATAPDYYGLDSPEAATAIPRDSVLDLTPYVRDGVLEWDAPPGQWRIVRFGSSLTGHTNGPAPAEATGLEVDKLDAGRVERYLAHWLSLYEEAVGPEMLGDRGIRSLLSDSIESGPQNWTDRLPEEFQARRGYPLTPWMVALAGYTVGSAADTDAFLWDFRQTIAELYADAYYGTVARVARERGLAYYAEALEDHRPQLGDDLQMRSHADIPMGAGWVFPPDADPKPTYVVDLKGASSVAHVYGKPFTGAESFSAFGEPYATAPRHLKHVADLELALGVTRFCIHTSPHQPSEVRPPGISLSPHLGQTFTRHETWAEQAGGWVDYLSRSSHLLNQGVPVADVAYFIGEESPVTGLFGDRLPDDVPAGYDYDFVGADALFTALTADESGRLMSAGGARYRVLYLGGSSARMTVRVLRRLLELVTSGASLVGHRPHGTPSLRDDPERFAQLVDELWGASPSSRRTVGRGVVREMTLSEALGDARIDPDWRPVAGVRMLHRQLPDRDVYFVSNTTPEAVSATLDVRAAGAAVEWWSAVEGSRWALPATSTMGRTATRVLLGAHEAAFLVVGDATTDEPVPLFRPLATADDDWVVEVPATGTNLGPATLSDVHEAIERSNLGGFSGTSRWRSIIRLPEGEPRDGGRYRVELGDVGDIATVRVNGAEAGVLWTAPWGIDVTAQLAPGENALEIDITNPWWNRIVADAASGEPATQLTGPVLSPSAPLRKWGLTGPVVLQRSAPHGITNAN